MVSSKLLIFFFEIIIIFIEPDFLETWANLPDNLWILLLGECQGAEKLNTWSTLCKHFLRSLDLKKWNWNIENFLYVQKQSCHLKVTLNGELDKPTEFFLQADLTFITSHVRNGDSTEIFLKVGTHQIISGPRCSNILSQICSYCLFISPWRESRQFKRQDNLKFLQHFCFV